MKSNEWTPDLADHIEQLLEESYATQSAFSDLSIEQVGQVIDEARESFESSEDSSPAFLTEKASYEKCVEMYCTILMAIEALNRPMPEETLGELSGRQQRTQLFQIPGRDKGMPAPPPLAARGNPPTLKHPTPTPAPVTPEAEEEEVLEFSAEAVPAEEELEMKPMAEIVDHAAPEATDDIWGQPAAPAPKNEVSEDFANPMENLQSAPKTLFEDEAVPSPVDLTEGAEEEEWKEKPTSKAPAPAHAASNNHILPPAPTALISNLAQEYWKQGEYFKNHLKADNWPLSQPLLLKLIGQSLCFSLESECAERLEPALKSFWNRRESAIRALLDNGNRKFELHPALKKAMDHAAEEHTEWLLEGKFPHAAVLSSLRYMLATLQPEKFQPSLIEAGIFIFFFGQNTSAEAFPLQNMMGASGLDTRQATEFLFRMSRLHRLKNKFLSASGVLELGQLLILEQDFQMVIDLLEKLQIDSHAFKEVA